MTKREQRVRNFLHWLREHPHHFVGFNDYSPPRHEIVERSGKTIYSPIYKSFTVRGHGVRTTISMSTFEDAKPFFEPASDSEDRAFRPNDEGMKILNGELTGFLEEN